MTHDNRIEVSPDLCFTSTDFNRPPHNRSHRSDNSVAALNAETVPMREQITVTENREVRIGLSWDHELDMLGLLEVALQIAVDQPLDAGINPPLHSGFASRAAMIAHHARNEQSPELASHSLQTTGKNISEIIDGLLRRPVIRRQEFFMDISRDHVAAQAHNAARVLRLGPAHVIVGQVDGRLHELLGPLAHDGFVELVDTRDFFLDNKLACVPVAPNGHWGPALASMTFT